MLCLDILLQVKRTEVFDAVYQGNSEQDHHGKPHANVEVEVPDRFLQLPQGRNGAQKPDNNCVDE
jgi:hypothetical protein